MTAKDASSSREELCKLLGDLPPRGLPISSKLISSVERDGFVLETLTLSLNGVEEVPAYFVKPKGAKGRLPAILFNHSHGGRYELGKTELLAGNSYLPEPSYAKELSAAGWSVLAIDHWCFGERSGRGESETFKEMLWNGQSLWGMMVYDSIRALDYLASRDDVDSSRLGTLGMSMGSTMAWWLAALDERVKVCVDICCLTDFHSLVKTRGLDGHGVYYYVPGLLKSFTTSRINALIAPRAHLALAGLYDRLTPAAGLDIVDADLKRAYAEAGAPQNWRLSRYSVGHRETAAMRKETMDFLKAML